MPVRTVPNTNPPLRYYLVAFDEDGRERREPDNSLLSETLLQTLRDEPVTDVLAMSHGWLGDVPGAVAQYDDWTRNLMADTAGVRAAGQRRPGFRPLLVGLHWPSKPWGDESLGGSFDIGAEAGTLDQNVERAASEQAARLGVGAEAEGELRKIYRAYSTIDNPDTLPADVEQSYRRLHDLLQPASAAAVPAEGMPPFDPQSIFQAARSFQQNDLAAGASFGALSWDTLLTPLRALSFWRMKDRARDIGEGGAHRFLVAMQAAAGAKDVRFHLMGHSFGCIVMTGAATGPVNEAPLSKPVQSMVLVQGALSLWAYCDSLPNSPGTRGYFNPLIARQRCKGPIAVTLSQYDTSVGRLYPLAAGLAGQDSFADPTQLPEYGGVGTWGVQGLDALTESRRIAAMTEDYGFQPGRIYNLSAGAVISGNAGQNDAHTDIVHPEVAHLLWQAQL